jgi:stage V sporulation protein B
MYLSMTLGSILHGLGKTNAAFIHNVISIVIRLGFLWFLVPQIGIIGYLWGLLISNLVVTALHGICVARNVAFQFSAVECIIKPTAWLFCSLAVGELLRFILSFSNFTGKIYNVFSAAVCAGAICLVFLYFMVRDFRELRS